MKETFIWRVQDRFGDGPYRGRTRISDILQGADSDDFSAQHQPTPWDDAGLKNLFNASVYKNWVFGFRNLDQYHRWFSDDETRQNLHSFGFYLARYKVGENIWHGQAQCMFDATKAEVIDFRLCHADKTISPENVDHPPIQKYIRRINGDTPMARLSRRIFG